MINWLKGWWHGRKTIPVQLINLADPYYAKEIKPCENGRMTLVAVYDPNKGQVTCFDCDTVLWEE